MFAFPSFSPFESLIFKTAFLRIGPLHLAPSSRWNAFPGSKRSHEGISVFVSPQVGSLIQLENWIIQIGPRELVSRLFQNALKTGAGILQSALQGTRTHMKCIRNFLYRRT